MGSAANVMLCADERSELTACKKTKTLHLYIFFVIVLRIKFIKNQFKGQH